jgi:hypothetical protein
MQFGAGMNGNINVLRKYLEENTQKSLTQADSKVESYIFKGYNSFKSAAF